ncbi:MAG: SDR family NAD(P)-dependent oxidoreductase, partial [Anaerolineaceae bacterium]|nr:SDR family NAD(P)-dependent oxidoreductase [Anaerolineaceae bacterium]
MQEFQGKVAVITGGASGIGLGLARQAAAEGMHLVLADVEQEALDAAAAELRAGGAEVLPLRTDVSRLEDVEALAEQAWARFGGVHLLCNNAGVGSAVAGSVLAGPRRHLQGAAGGDHLG